MTEFKDCFWVIIFNKFEKIRQNKSNHLFENKGPNRLRRAQKVHETRQRILQRSSLNPDRTSRTRVKLLKRSKQNELKASKAVQRLSWRSVRSVASSVNSVRYWSWNAQSIRVCTPRRNHQASQNTRWQSEQMPEACMRLRFTFFTEFFSLTFTAFYNFKVELKVEKVIKNLSDRKAEDYKVNRNIKTSIFILTSQMSLFKPLTLKFIQYSSLLITIKLFFNWMIIFYCQIKSYEKKFETFC